MVERQNKGSVELNDQKEQKEQKINQIKNVQENINRTRRLTFENNIIECLWKNTDHVVVSKILNERLGSIEDLKNLNDFLQSLPEEVRDGKAEQALRFINSWFSVENAKASILTGETRSCQLKKGLSLSYSDNVVMQQLSQIIDQSIENWENPFISNWNNSYYAVKVPENFMKMWWDPEINNEVSKTGVFVIENFDEKKISNFKILAIAKSEERLYERIKRSENPDELIKNRDFFEQFKQYVYLRTNNISNKLKENEVKYIENYYRIFLNQKLFLKVEWIDSNIENEWKESEEEINRECMRIMEEAQKKAKELNNQYVDNFLPKDNSEWLKEEKKELKKSNFNTAKWVVIAEELNLWNKLWNYGVNLDSYDVNYPDLQEIAFTNERQDFIKNNDELKGIITKGDMLEYNIFDKEHNMLNLDGRQKFCEESSTVKWMEGEELERLWEILNEFFWWYESTFSALLNNPSTQKESVNNYIKNYAIGSVIDNIKDIFTEMAKNFEWNLLNKWFIFTDDEPVKIDWNNLIIKWKFNWTDIVIRYDLSTGEVFMNSFIQYNATDNKFKIWENSGAYQKIWDFEKFSDYLSNRYESKFQNLNDVKNISNNIQLIWEDIINTSKKQSTKNTAVMKLLKTYNILWYPWGLENIDFKSDSKFFKFFQIIDETAKDNNNGIKALDYFNNKFMPIIMEYYWLTWWENNLEQNKNNPKSSIFFDESNDNSAIKELRDKIWNFNPNAFKWIGNFDATQNLWILDFILDNLLNSTGTEIDISKMDDFIRGLESGGENS